MTPHNRLIKQLHYGLGKWEQFGPAVVGKLQALVIQAERQDKDEISIAELQEGISQIVTSMNAQK